MQETKPKPMKIGIAKVDHHAGSQGCTIPAIKQATQKQLHARSIPFDAVVTIRRNAILKSV